MTEYRLGVLENYEWQQPVEDRVTQPAGGEAKGYRYLITTGAGDFAGEDGNIATAKKANPASADDWYFDDKREGMVVYLKDEDKVYQYINSWNELRLSCLFDVDRDTGIQVEESADEDKIRFDVEGTEVLIIGDGTNEPLAEINNYGTNHGLYINQDEVLAANKYGLYVYSNQIQTNDSKLVYIHSDQTSSTHDLVHLKNDGSGYGLYVQQSGALAANKNALYVYGGAANANAALVLFEQTNASASADAVEIDNDGTGHGLYLHQDGVLAANKYGLYVYSNAVQVNSPLVYVYNDNASSTKETLFFKNDGSGNTLRINQVGVLGASQHGLYVYSNAVQDTSQLFRVYQNNSSATYDMAEFYNSGQGTNVNIYQGTDLAVSSYALYVRSNVAQTNSPLVYFYQDHVDTTSDLLKLSNDGSGNALIIKQDGNLASGKYALYIDNNGTPVDGAGRCIRLDGCTISSTKNPETDAEAGFIAVNIDGTQYAVPYYALS